MVNRILGMRTGGVSEFGMRGKSEDRRTRDG
jgi:hypothetical protein